MLFLITICKISSRFRYFGMDLVSYRAIFPVSVQLNHIHPLRQNRNGAKIKSTPTHLYHTKILGYISSNAHKPDKPHNQRTIHDQQHISEKRFCIVSRLTTTEKDIRTAYPDIADCITHGSLQITPCNCIVYLLLRSALYQQYKQYHYIHGRYHNYFLLIRYSASITDQNRTTANRSASITDQHNRKPTPEAITQKKKRYISTASLSFYT